MSKECLINYKCNNREFSLKNFPVGLFASVMGISGLSLAWRQAGIQFELGQNMGNWIGIFAVAVFLMLIITYTVKATVHTDSVISEFNHPVSGNFFGTAAIATLLISSVIAPLSQYASEVVWLIGSTGTIALAFTILNRLLQGKVDVSHAVPAWLIPGVATLDVAVTGGEMPMAFSHEINLFTISIGAVIALLFFTMIMSRLIHHHDRLAGHMIPSLMILIAPFEVGSLAYSNYLHRVDLFSGALFYFGLFGFFLLTPKIFRSGIPFSAGWWTVGFPLAALSVAALKYADHVRSWPITAIAIVLLVFVTFVIAALSVKTVCILCNGQLLSGR